MSPSVSPKPTSPKEDTIAILLGLTKRVMTNIQAFALFYYNSCPAVCTAQNSSFLSVFLSRIFHPPSLSLPDSPIVVYLSSHFPTYLCCKSFFSCMTLSSSSTNESINGKSLMLLAVVHIRFASSLCFLSVLSCLPFVSSCLLLLFWR